MVRSMAGLSQAERAAPDLTGCMPHPARGGHARWGLGVVPVARFAVVDRIFDNSTATLTHIPELIRWGLLGPLPCLARAGRDFSCPPHPSTSGLG